MKKLLIGISILFLLAGCDRITMIGVKVVAKSDDAYRCGRLNEVCHSYLITVEDSNGSKFNILTNASDYLLAGEGSIVDVRQNLSDVSSYTIYPHKK